MQRRPQLLFLLYALCLLAYTHNLNAQGDVVARPNNFSMRVGDDAQEILFESAGKPVKGVKCVVPKSAGRSVGLMETETSDNGRIYVVGKSPAEGLVLVCTAPGGKDIPIYITQISMRRTGVLCDDLENVKTHADRIEFFSNMIPRMTSEQINKLLTDCDKDKIVTSPTILDYRTVRDNYGKGVGEAFVVVQINISNRSDSSKFYLQNAQVALDPNKCSEASEYFDKIYYSGEIQVARLETEIAKPGKANDQNLKTLLHEAKDVRSDNAESLKNSKQKFLQQCIDQFMQNFQYPIALSAISRDKVLGVANASLYRSPRRIGFQIANFVSAMNPVLSGLNFLGRDGKSLFGFLGTTIIPEADKGIPNISNDKMKALEGAIKNGDIIIDPGKSEVINIFIESRYFFSSVTFPKYKASAKKATLEQLDFNRLLKLFLVSSVDGILIANDAPKVVSKPGSGLPDPATFQRPVME
jgi:hypothetical protein